MWKYSKFFNNKNIFFYHVVRNSLANRAFLPTPLTEKKNTLLLENIIYGDLIGQENKKTKLIVFLEIGLLRELGVAIAVKIIFFVYLELNITNLYLYYSLSIW